MLRTEHYCERTKSNVVKLESNVMELNTIKRELNTSTSKSDFTNPENDCSPETMKIKLEDSSGDGTTEGSLNDKRQRDDDDKGGDSDTEIKLKKAKVKKVEKSEFSDDDEDDKSNSSDDENSIKKNRSKANLAARPKIKNIRKNIRDILSEDKLEEGTLNAQKEEKLRLQRLQEKRNAIREYMEKQEVRGKLGISKYFQPSKCAYTNV